MNLATLATAAQITTPWLLDEDNILLNTIRSVRQTENGKEMNEVFWQIVALLGFAKARSGDECLTRFNSQWRNVRIKKLDESRTRPIKVTEIEGERRYRIIYKWKIKDDEELLNVMQYSSTWENVSNRLKKFTAEECQERYENHLQKICGPDQIGNMGRVELQPVPYRIVKKMTTLPFGIAQMQEAARINERRHVEDLSAVHRFEEQAQADEGHGKEKEPHTKKRDSHTQSDTSVRDRIVHELFEDEKPSDEDMGKSKKKNRRQFVPEVEVDYPPLGTGNIDLTLSPYDWSYESSEEIASSDSDSSNDYEDKEFDDVSSDGATHQKEIAKGNRTGAASKGGWSDKEVNKFLTGLRIYKEDWQTIKSEYFPNQRTVAALKSFFNNISDIFRHVKWKQYGTNDVRIEVNREEGKLDINATEDTESRVELVYVGEREAKWTPEDDQILLNEFYRENCTYQQVSKKLYLRHSAGDCMRRIKDWKKHEKINSLKGRVLVKIDEKGQHYLERAKSQASRSSDSKSGKRRSRAVDSRRRSNRLKRMRTDDGAKNSEQDLDV